MYPNVLETPQSSLTFLSQVAVAFAAARLGTMVLVVGKFLEFHGLVMILVTYNIIIG